MNLYVEVTHTEHSDINTGIQRVVRNVLRHLIEFGPEEGINVFPVVYRDGAFFLILPDDVLRDKSAISKPLIENSGSSTKKRIKKLLRPLYRLLLGALGAIFAFPRARAFIYAPTTSFGLGWLILLPWRVAKRVLHPSPSAGVASEGSLGTANRFSPQVTRPEEPDLEAIIATRCSERHVLLLLDSSWVYDIWTPISRMKEKGVKVVSVIYDLIPITHGYTCVEPLVRAFRVWLDGQVRYSDGIVCISKSTAAVVRKYFVTNAPLLGVTQQIPISSFYLGSELDFVSHKIPVQPKILSLRKAGSPLFLMVGTIEPRKNHRQVFNAFRRLWALGAEVRLVIVSARSWKSDDLLQQIIEHPEYERRLFLIRDASDTDIDWLYRNSDALIMASEIEGFGLPIVEARQRGLPVICSDIPVFREITIPGTDFFLLYDVDDLVRVVKEFVARPRNSERLATGWITWRESARELLSEVKLMESKARTC